MIKLSPIIALLVFCLVSPAHAEQLTAEQIAQRTYDRYIGDDMQMLGKMELISPRGHIRTREFISLRKDTEDARLQRIRFTSPADIDGTGFLTIEKDNSQNTEQHLYLPALKRTRRIVASQKGRSFVNSDFTYEDMQRHPVEEWSYRLKGNEKILGRECYVLVSTPKEDTESQYTRLVSWVDKEHFMLLKAYFFDKKGQHSKTYKVVEFEEVMDIATELVVVMENLDSGYKTRLTTLQIVYNSDLKDSLFTTRALEN